MYHSLVTNLDLSSNLLGHIKLNSSRLYTIAFFSLGEDGSNLIFKVYLMCYLEFISIDLIDKRNGMAGYGLCVICG